MAEITAKIAIIRPTSAMIMAVFVFWFIDCILVLIADICMLRLVTWNCK